MSLVMIMVAAAAAVLVCVSEARLQIYPSSLLLPNPPSPTSFNFSCREVGEGVEPERPAIEVQWLKDGEVIVTEGRKKYRHYRRKRLLEINDIDYTDQGVYKCRHLAGQEGEMGSAELWITPVVDGAPHIQTASVGSEVWVSCQVRGGEYNVTWTQSGAIVASSNGTSLSSRFSVSSNDSLVITSGYHNDSGCYTCTASNRAGSSSARVQLIVTDDGTPTTEAVAASLCVSDGNERNDNSTSSTPACRLATGIVTTTTEGCKVLEDVSRSEQRRFSAETTTGGKMFAPVFLQKPHHCLRAIAGYTVELPCVVSGNPTPQVRWIKDNITITGNEQQSVSVAGTGSWRHHFQQDDNNTLRINSVAENDGGVYECVAENSEGRRSAVTTLGVWGASDVCGCVRERGGSGGRRRRITEGLEVTSPEHYPWQVLIEYRNRHSDKLCGGTLLRPDWLLTAAHCLHAGHRWLDTSELVVKVGVVNRSSTSEPSQQQLQVDYILSHPEYNTSFQHLVNKVPEYDIALIRLRYPAILNEAVRPACLPAVNSDPSTGTICHISGWGHLDFEQGPSPTILHHTLVPLVNYSNCRHEDAYGNAVTRKHLCAGFDAGGPDACQNDSGGPLVCERGRRWRLFGVVNHGIGCGEERKYGLYARVVRYNSWIKAVLDVRS